MILSRTLLTILLIGSLMIVACDGDDDNAGNATATSVPTVHADESSPPAYSEPTIIPSSGDTATVIVEVSNPNDSAWLQIGDFTVTVYSSADAILATREHETPLPPGASAWIIAENIDAPAAQIDRVEVSTNSPWQTDEYPGPTVTTDKVALDASGMNLVGEVTNTGTIDAAYVHVAAVFRDGTGKITGGSWANTDTIAPGSTSVFNGLLYGEGSTTIEHKAYAVHSIIVMGP